MRRDKREIIDITKIINIIDECSVFRLAMAYHNIPYIVPLNFAYQIVDNKFEFYFHCANEGKKLEIIKENNNVCFEMDCKHELISAETACGYGYRYCSIIGNGKIEIVNDIECKKHALSLLMKHQTKKEFIFNNEQAQAVTICKIIDINLSAKENR